VAPRGTRASTFASIVVAVAGLGFAGCAGPSTPGTICKRLLEDEITRSCDKSEMDREGLIEAVQFKLGFAGKPDIGVVDLASFRTRDAGEKFIADVDAFTREGNSMLRTRFGDAASAGEMKSEVFKSKSGKTVAAVYSTAVEYEKIRDKRDKVRSLVIAAP
jgi:hypothetical protein